MTRSYTLKIILSICKTIDGYLEKPIRYKQFLASVAALLAGKQ